MTHTEYMRGWRERNREQYRQIVRKAGAKWRRLHPVAVLHKRKADQEKLFGGNRTNTLERDHYRCVQCGRKRNLSVDHIDGDRSHNEMSNLQTLCFKCHGHKDGVRGWKWLSVGYATRVNK